MVGCVLARTLLDLPFEQVAAMTRAWGDVLLREADATSSAGVAPRAGQFGACEHTPYGVVSEMTLPPSRSAACTAHGLAIRLSTPQLDVRMALSEMSLRHQAPSQRIFFTAA